MGTEREVKNDDHKVASPGYRDYGALALVPVDRLRNLETVHAVGAPEYFLVRPRLFITVEVLANR